MIHWEEGEDERGLLVWHRYIDCGHWGLVLTNVLPRWITPRSWERGIAQVRVT
jgi:hypothetical protein